MAYVVEGRVWKFGDNINTDLIYPNTAFRAPEKEQHRLTFSSNRPGWVDLVKEGDLLVGAEALHLHAGMVRGVQLVEAHIPVLRGRIELHRHVHQSEADRPRPHRSSHGGPPKCVVSPRMLPRPLYVRRATHPHARLLRACRAVPATPPRTAARRSRTLAP